jgi:hypothetical protein
MVWGLKWLVSLFLYIPLISFILINYLFIKKKKKIEEEFDVEEQLRSNLCRYRKHVGGDMYASVPKGDAIILKVS